MNNIDPKTVVTQWEAHLNKCAKCRRYEKGNTATLVHTCPEGSWLLKDVLELEMKPILIKQRRRENEVYRAAMKITPESGPTTKKKAQAAMRFKE